MYPPTEFQKAASESQAEPTSWNAYSRLARRVPSFPPMKGNERGRVVRREGRKDLLYTYAGCFVLSFHFPNLLICFLSEEVRVLNLGMYGPT